MDLLDGDRHRKIRGMPSRKPSSECSMRISSMLSCFAPATVSFVSGKVNSIQTLARWPSSKRVAQLFLRTHCRCQANCRCFDKPLGSLDVFWTRRTVFFLRFHRPSVAMGFDGSRTLLLVDELHNIERVIPFSKMRQRISEGYATSFDVFGHRLGLSATPLSDFDDNIGSFCRSFADPHQDYTAREDWNESTLEEQRQIRISKFGRIQRSLLLRTGSRHQARGVGHALITLRGNTRQLRRSTRASERTKVLEKKISDGEAPPGTTPSWHENIQEIAQ